MSTSDPGDPPSAYHDPVRRTADGTYALELPTELRRLLGSLATEMRELLTTDSELLVRLFPPPYGDDDERNAGYAVLAGAELVERRMSAFEALQELADATELDEEQLMSWMRSINDIRLVLGTMLGFSDDDDEFAQQERGPHETTTYQIYLLLSDLLNDIVAALAD